MNIELIIFDFDGTLGDTRHIIATTMKMTVEELHLPMRTEEECASKIGLPLDGCFEALYPDEGEATIKRCAETYRRIFKENTHVIRPKLFPRVKETLALLKEEGYTLTIASSRWHKSLVELTEELQIAEYISYLIGADDVVNAKPDAEPVVRTLEAMHMDANKTLVVGDMNVDIRMGANAGCRTCGVSYGNGKRSELEEAHADYIIDGFEELTDILNK